MNLLNTEAYKFEDLIFFTFSLMFPNRFFEINYIDLHSTDCLKILPNQIPTSLYTLMRMH